MQTATGWQKREEAVGPFFGSNLVGMVVSTLQRKGHFFFGFFLFCFENIMSCLWALFSKEVFN